MAVTDTVERARLLQEVVAGVAVPTLFWSAALPDIDEDILARPCWFVGAEDEQKALFDDDHLEVNRQALPALYPGQWKRILPCMKKVYF